MSIIYVVSGLLLVAVIMAVCWFLADMIIPQSEIDKIDAVGRWAKEELDRRAQLEDSMEQESGCIGNSINKKE